MPSEIRPSSEKGREESDRRSPSGNPEKRPQKDFTTRGFGSGPAGQYHLRFTESSHQEGEQSKKKDIMIADTQIERDNYKREIYIRNNIKAIQEILAERGGKTLPHCEVQLGHREGLRGGTPDEAEAFFNSLSSDDQEKISQAWRGEDGKNKLGTEERRLYDQWHQIYDQTRNFSEMPREEQIDKLIEDLIKRPGTSHDSSEIREYMHCNLIGYDEFPVVRTMVNKLCLDPDTKKSVIEALSNIYTV